MESGFWVTTTFFSIYFTFFPLRAIVSSSANRTASAVLRVDAGNPRLITMICLTLAIACSSVSVNRMWVFLAMTTKYATMGYKSS